MSLRQLLHRLRRLDTWLVPPAIAVVIFLELTHSSLVQELEFDLWDKALHFTAYAGLAVMTTMSVRADRRAVWWALALVLMGGALEIVQGMTGRDADIFDEIANTLGVIAGLGFTWVGIALLRARGLLDTPPK